jgi:hypothetical protein
MSFELCRSYSRAKISAELGGGYQSALPESKGIVVCGCFKPTHRWNPGAPEEVTLGIKQSVRYAARKLTVPLMRSSSTGAISASRTSDVISGRYILNVVPMPGSL